MGIVKSYSFIFDDENWIMKILIGTIILWIPIINLAALGYIIKIAQNVVHDNPPLLPDWEEFGDHLVRGLHLILISVVYSVPLGILLFVELCFILSNTMSSNGSAGKPDWLILLYIPVVLVMIPVGNAALVRYVRAKRLRAAFEFGKVFLMLFTVPSLWLRLFFDIIVDTLIASFPLAIPICGAAVAVTAFIAGCAWAYQLGEFALRQNRYQV